MKKKNNVIDIKNTMIGKSILIFFMKVLGAISAFLSTLSITQSLEIDEAGVFFVIYILAAILSTFSRFGTDLVLIKYISLQEKKIIHFCFFLVTAAIMLVVCITSFFAKEVSYLFFDTIAYYKDVLHMSFIIIFMSFYTFISNILQGYHRHCASIFFVNVFPHLALLLYILAVSSVTISDLVFVLLIISCINFISSLFYLIYIKRKKMIINMSFSKRRILDFLLWFDKRYFFNCYALWITAVSITAVQFGCQLIASIFLDEKDIALLSVAQRVSVFSFFFAGSVNMILSPNISKIYHKKNNFAFKESISNATKISFFLSLPLILMPILFSDSIMLIFGDEYISGSSLLIILIFGQLVNIFASQINPILSMCGGEKELRNITVFSGIFAIIMSAILCYFFGVMGVAVSIALSAMMHNFIGLVVVRKRHGFYPIVGFI